jgi:threonine synthase
MLAEKGGVYIMIGVSCCMYIPNNTVPSGTITEAPQELTTLSKELAEISGINDPFTDLMKKLFERWKGWMTSFLNSLVLVSRVLILAGCCIMPCV